MLPFLTRGWIENLCRRMDSQDTLGIWKNEMTGNGKHTYQDEPPQALQQ